MPVRDSLSRCESNSYSNHYDVRNRPNAKPAMSATQPINKDTLQISRNQLEKEALSRLRHTSKYVIVQSGFARIGKYLFVAVAFPPYLVLYGIPKWLLTTALPSIYGNFSLLANRVKAPFQKKLRVFVNKLASLTQTIGHALNVLVQPVIRLALEIRNSLQRFRKTVFSFFRKFVDREKRESFSSRLSKGAARFAKRLEKRFGQAYEWLARQSSSLANPIKNGLNWLKRAKEKKWEPSKWKRLSLAMSQPFIQKFRLSKQIANQVSALFNRSSAFCKGHLKAAALFIAKPYRQKIQPVVRSAIHLVYARLASFIQSCGSFFGERKRRLLVWGDQKRQALHRLTPKPILSYLSSVVSFKEIPDFMRRFFKRLLGSRWLELIIQGGLKVASSSFSFFYYGADWLFRLTGSAGTTLSRLIKEGIKACSSGFRLGTSGFSKGYGWLDKATRACFYHLLVGLVMAVILCVWGGRLLGRLAQRLGVLSKRRHRQSSQ